MERESNTQSNYYKNYTYMCFYMCKILKNIYVDIHKNYIYISSRYLSIWIDASIIYLPFYFSPSDSNILSLQVKFGNLTSI